MRITMRSLFLILLLNSIGLPVAGAAQALPEVGSRIRISQVDGQVLTGTIQESSPDAVIILTEPNEMNARVPYTDIRKLEWNTGGKRSFGKYFAISVLTIAAALGTATALATEDECSGELFCSPAENFAIGAMAGAIIGIPAGIIAGLSIREPEWLPIGLPRPIGVTLSVGPAARRPGGVVTAISIRTP